MKFFFVMKLFLRLSVKSICCKSLFVGITSLGVVPQAYELTQLDPARVKFGNYYIILYSPSFPMRRQFNNPEIRIHLHINTDINLIRVMAMRMGL